MCVCLSVTTPLRPRPAKQHSTRQRASSAIVPCFPSRPTSQGASCRVESMRLLVAACSLGMPMHLPALRSCRSLHSSIVMNTNRDAPPPTKMAAIEAALATKATQPVILLARPFEPGNIGAVARAMLNFGLSDLRLVAPLTQPWLTEEAQARACGAAPLLDEAQTFVDMPAATDDLQLVLATTARPREANVPVLTPRAAAELAAEAISCGSNHSHPHPHPGPSPSPSLNPSPSPSRSPRPRPGLSPNPRPTPSLKPYLTQTLALALRRPSYCLKPPRNRPSRFPGSSAHHWPVSRLGS